MSVQQQIEDMESQLKSVGKSVAVFCRHAELARSTWDRWKAKKNAPNMGTWERVRGEFDTFMVMAEAPDQSQEAAE